MSAFLEKTYEFSRQVSQTNSSCSVVNVVLGNESADLDSIVSSIVLAYYLSCQSGSDLYIPVINIPQVEFELRKDVVRLLNWAKSQLVFIDQIDLDKIYRLGKLNLVLVDHHELSPVQTLFVSSISKVIDHHERNEDVLCKMPAKAEIVIEYVGSCSSLIFEKCMQKIDKDFQRPLLGAILLDTSNLQSKVTPKDIKAVEILSNALKRQERNFSIDKFYKKMKKLKRDIDSFSCEQVLSKDFKNIKLKNAESVGFSTVPCSIEELLETCLNPVDNLAAFCQIKKLDTLIVLCNAKSLGKFIIVFSVKFTTTKLINNAFLTDRSFEEAKVEKLNLDSDKNLADDRCEFYRRNNSDWTRKQFLPKIRQFLENTTQNVKNTARRSPKDFLTMKGSAKSFSMTYDTDEGPSPDEPKSIVSNSLCAMSGKIEGEFVMTKEETANDLSSKDVESTRSASFYGSLIDDVIQNSVDQLRAELHDEEIFLAASSKEHLDALDSENLQFSTPIGKVISSSNSDVTSSETSPESVKELRVADEPVKAAEPVGSIEKSKSSSESHENSTEPQNNAKLQPSYPPTPPNSFMNTPRQPETPSTKNIAPETITDELKKLSDHLENVQRKKEPVPAIELPPSPRGAGPQEVASPKSETDRSTARSTADSIQVEWQDDDLVPLVRLDDRNPSFSAKGDADAVRRLSEDASELLSPRPLMGVEDLEWENDTPVQDPKPSDVLPESQSGQFSTVLIGGVEHKVDLGLVEPYRKAFSHGGYFDDGLTAMVVFSACHLPKKSTPSYAVLMDNLFWYALSWLETIVCQDYVIIYLQGGADAEQLPSFTWLRKCYKVLDRSVRKNLKQMLLVHSTFWLRAFLIMIRPFLSSKFWHKMIFVQSLEELSKLVPVQIEIPDSVKKFDSR